jgi:uncharacterized protein YpbB
MFNPLLPDISKLKNEDLETKITELMKKYTIAARSGQGMVCQQISIILESYRAEQTRRYDLEMKKLNKQNKNLDDFIQVDD